MSLRGGAHERVYRWCLRLYPAAFRARFGDEMVQLFGDLMRDARTRDVAAGPARLWFRTIWDLAVTAPSEHRADRALAHSLSVPPSHGNRALGILGVLGGAVLLAAFFPTLDIAPPLNQVRLILFSVGALAIIVGVHRRQARAARGGR